MSTNMSMRPDEPFRRVEVIIEPQAGSELGGGLHRIGQDASERLDVIPARFR